MVHRQIEMFIVCFKLNSKVKKKFNWIEELRQHIRCLYSLQLKSGVIPEWTRN